MGTGGYWYNLFVLFEYVKRLGEREREYTLVFLSGILLGKNAVLQGFSNLTDWGQGT